MTEEADEEKERKNMSAGAEKSMSRKRGNLDRD